MPSTGFNLTGVKQMQARIAAVVKEMPDRAAKALYLEAQIEKTEAQRRTPVDTGVLRASAMVSEPQRNGKTISVTISFGGAAEKYAIIVHEDPDAFHKVGQWKYLESTLQESEKYMLGRLAARLHL